ncbi:iron-sulfur cluster assembly scaffold protein [Patescibacteria group bacterium]|nr:iron-sulfur cluster assembly scaffold protein [Patescibacteria group bacterium]
MTSQPKIKDKQGNTWLYSDVVKDHFFNPRNLMPQGKEDSFEADGMGRVGSPACGDEMVVWIKVEDDPSTGSGKAKIIDCKWQTFGCGSAIASTSIMSEMVLENGGMSIKDALKITPQDILKRLGGLPPNKIHCSVLGDQALTAAIKDYYSRLSSRPKS